MGMGKRNVVLYCFIFIVFLFQGSTLTAGVNDPGTNPVKDSKPIRSQYSDVPKAEKSATQHKIVIGGAKISYTATAGTLIVRNAEDLPYASIGYTAYTKNDISDPSHRPITFAYNGGPGSSSIWLHMGALGPRRIVTSDAISTPPPPYNIINNEYSVLDRTDLVMIDPVGTGFSKAVGKAKKKDFWGVDPDIESISRFIRQYITDNGRWNSPKYLLGESYGTTRSAGVVNYLQKKEGMAFNGVILVSMATDLELAFADYIPGNERSLPLTLPTYTAIAWYHKVLPDPPTELAPILREVRAFALGEYMHALAQGCELPDADRKAIIEKLHRYTGLSSDYLDKANLRVTLPKFTSEILRERRDTVGRLDARFVGVMFDPLGEFSEYDPQDAATTPAFAAAFLDYMHRDLNFGHGQTYVMQAAAGDTWDFRHEIEGGWMTQPVVNTGVDLAHAMGFNPNLRVLVLQGIYDLATPFFATEYMVSHLNLRKDLRTHIEVKYYDAGHMMYIHEPSLKKFKHDVAVFIDGTDRL
jgi:carboxypeptidase C (cathepsin A)